MSDELEEVTPLSTIACEPCRQKKCKCDRVIPVCSSCTSDPSKCWYSHGAKRGLPAGYLNSLEHRLTETEAALFHALNELYGEPTDAHGLPNLRDTLTQRVSSSKIDAVREWKSLPLETREDAHQWWLTRRSVFSQATSDLHMSSNDQPPTAKSQNGPGNSQPQKNMYQDWFTIPARTPNTESNAVETSQLPLPSASSDMDAQIEGWGNMPQAAADSISNTRFTTHAQIGASSRSPAQGGTPLADDGFVKAKALAEARKDTYF
ncbi:hypothetical protein NA57DRAFT_76169 [Rhizodiscina lignyota]|uniref:Zn(2)-C6 fungal-type domain-containing protein n=1 Tax=Rhizodiscina lignyota TaxID=1504668 RepID=A0A9P4M6J1_9PEZI|nr:hypothetical protein NA57DRAFT_76169 [Rhizodiscina lignyota]